MWLEIKNIIYQLAFFLCQHSQTIIPSPKNVLKPSECLIINHAFRLLVQNWTNSLNFQLLNYNDFVKFKKLNIVLLKNYETYPIIKTFEFYIYMLVVDDASVTNLLTFPSRGWISKMQLVNEQFGPLFFRNR